MVFHAAALKHLPLLRDPPRRGAEDERLGHALGARRRGQRPGSSDFVNISTDKAADPASALGYSKRVAEALTSHYGRREHGTYLSVRFGNVLGSRGSVLTAFRAQLDAGDRSHRHPPRRDPATS